MASAIPVPASATVCGLPSALSVKLRVSVKAPSCEGLNVTLTLQVLPAARVAAHVLFEIVKLTPCVTVMPPTLSAAVPVFFSVTVLATLVLFTASLPKLSEDGESVTVVRGERLIV